jgi:hypothetical protein
MNLPCPDHTALIAVDPATREGAGVARYMRDRDRPASAEIPVAAVDAWQGQARWHRAAAAAGADRPRDVGMGSLTAVMLAGNEAMARVGQLGPARVIERGHGAIEFGVRLTFEDGTVGDVDFSGRGWRTVLDPLREPAYFARVRVNAEAAPIVWPNGVDLPPREGSRPRLGAGTWPSARLGAGDLVAHQISAPFRSKKPPVGPSGPTSA